MLACLALACSYATAARAEAAAPKAAGEIVIGTHVDLSGPLSSWGASVRNGLTMAFEEANEMGGIGGRMLRLVVRDDTYDPREAARAVRTLADDDHVFAILSPLGTPTMHAAIDEALSRDVLYLFPLTASEEAFFPPSRLKFSLTPSHAMEVQEGLRRILNARGATKVGILATSDEFGRAVKQGATNELQRRGTAFAAEAVFSSSDVRLDDALDALHRQGVELVVLGTEAGQALQVMRAAAGMRWKPMFLCSSACYESEFATLAGNDAEGLYSVGQVPIPYPEDPKLGTWVHRYEAEFSTVANIHALTAYRSAHLFLTVLRQAGPAPSQAQFAKVLETRGTWTDPALGGLPAEFSSTDHLGSHTSLLAQIRRGRWTVLTDPVAPPPAQRSK